MKFLNSYFLLILTFITLLSSCDESEIVNPDNSSFWLESRNDFNKRTAWYNEAKIGVMISFGPGSLTGKEMSWCRKAYRKGEIDQSSPVFGDPTIDSSVYDNLYKEFNPKKFNPDKWVKLFSDAGIKYLIYVAKHHDGFCNFDTRSIEYKITSSNSPYRKDISKMLADAVHKSDMKFCFYYSPGDWYDPDYFTPTHSKYIDKLYMQVEELMTNYGKVDLMFFDTRWDMKYWDSEKVIKNMKRIQPNIMINDRSLYKGDYFTPEGFYGDFNNKIHWESLFGFIESWSWKPDYVLKGFDYYINQIARVAGNGGNLVWGIGPRPDGEIDPPQAEMLLQIGAWLKKYGESIYGTKGGPYQFPGINAFATQKGRTVYLFVRDWRGGDSFIVPDLGMSLSQCKALTGGATVYTVKNNFINISLDKKDRDSVLTIFKLTFRDNIKNVTKVIY